MKFFFADSMDMVDPSFDFELEVRSEWRVRQRHDLYPHEIFDVPPYHGVLISKAIVDGYWGRGSRYSLAQRQRFWRNGVRTFLRLDAGAEEKQSQNSRIPLRTMGDCGAFSYVKEESPPITTDEVIEFYETCGFDLGISVDHVILGFSANGSASMPGFDTATAAWRNRQSITLELANEFLLQCKHRSVGFIPLGVAQGWSPESYAYAVEQLQKMGYRRIALGGMVPLKTISILQCLEAIGAIRDPGTEFHLLGVTRSEHITQFKEFGVTSFDSTSPLRQAFMDSKDNFYTLERSYLAIRIPQMEGNAQLQSRIRSGELAQEFVRSLEERCMSELRNYDRGTTSIDSVLDAILKYEAVHHPKEKRRAAYREVLQDRPWVACRCAICQNIGIHVIVFRGTDRNKRRGFHNLQVFLARLHRELDKDNPVAA